jgi:putative transposase
MSAPSYIWRKLTPNQREELLEWRKAKERPWHTPPHRPNYGHLNFLVTATCYEHAPIIGFTAERMDAFSAALLDVLQQYCNRTFAWCVLPNHYHALVEAPNILRMLHELGRFHGRTSHAWNGEENKRGRQVFHGSVERFMRSERHYFATLNYVHNNPVHHGYARLWTDWLWSSAAEFIKHVGRTETERLWREYPLHEYGKKWDPADL